MDFETAPMEIEKKSMAIIAPYLADLSLSEEETKVYSRIIHAAGDVEYAPIIRLHRDAVAAAKKAIEGGADIFVDVEMVRTGINKKKLAEFGGQVHALIADEKIAALAKEEGITRAMAAMRSFGHDMDGGIVAIGNAPTALFEVLRLTEEENLRPAVIVGTPVGFVGAADSKKMLAENKKIPYITVEGTKGGSPIAVAAVNAVLYMLGSGDR